MNNICVTCSRCHKGQVVESECTILKDAVCRTAPVHVTSPHSQNVNISTVLPANFTSETPEVTHVRKACATQTRNTREPGRKGKSQLELIINDNKHREI